MSQPGPDVFYHALKLAGLPSHPELLRNRGFLFYDASGHYIFGSIVSIGYAAAEGITLRVSSPRFRGQQIRCLKKVDDVWAIVPEVGLEGKAAPFDEGTAPFKGTLRLF